MTIPISVTVTGGNIKKSAAVAEAIQESLAEKGFTDVKYVNRPFTKPQAVTTDGVTRSLLDQIQATYPKFLEDPIEVRAVPVMGLDMTSEEELAHYWRADVKDDVAQSFAQIDIDNKGVGEMQIIFTGDGYPPREPWKVDPEWVLVVKRAAEIATAKSEQLDDPHYSQAAKELTAEGLIGPQKKVHLRVVETEEPCQP